MAWQEPLCHPCGVSGSGRVVNFPLAAITRRTRLEGFRELRNEAWSCWELKRGAQAALMQPRHSRRTWLGGNLPPALNLQPLFPTFPQPPLFLFNWILTGISIILSLEIWSVRASNVLSPLACFRMSFIAEEKNRNENISEEKSAVHTYPYSSGGAE